MTLKERASQYVEQAALSLEQAGKDLATLAKAQPLKERSFISTYEKAYYLVRALRAFNTRVSQLPETQQIMNKEAITDDAMRLVNTLLEQEGGQAELELNTVSVDSMTHTAWMLRMTGAEPTAYIAKDIAHTHEIAMRAAQDKARLLGVQITRVIDNSTGGR
jgi:hypothetical protein